MSHVRLSPLDGAFLAAETPTAHMHVGWLALFSPPWAGVTFEALRAHIAGRLSRVPRFRQRLADVPLGLGDPVWVDDERFDLDRHVRRTDVADLDEITNAVFSVPLRRDRPLWELWIADALADGLIGVVGKVHHCMVDGVGAVELASLLLEATPEPAPADEEQWQPRAHPHALTLAGEEIVRLVQEQLALATLPARVLGSPTRAARAVRIAGRAAHALRDSLRPAPRVPGINEPISPDRLLTRARRPLSDLRTIASRHGTTINDVVLAACAGAVGRFLEERGELALPLKALVPVSTRSEGQGGALGNRLSYMFVDLPCDLPDPLLRLEAVSTATRRRKLAHEPEGATAILGALAYLPSPLRRLASRVASSPRTFNLVISNIPGPTDQLYMCGCELREAYPVVPLAEHHTLSIGFTSVRDQGCFGIYADRGSLGDAVLMPEDIDEAIDELLLLPATASPEPPVPRRPALV